LDRSQPEPAAHRNLLTIRHLDQHVVVVEKPSGINTVRHPAERNWNERRRELAPTLDDRLQYAIAARQQRPRSTLLRLRVVHRLDKETSGLVVFARSPLAEVDLGRQFRRHTVVRRYLAVVRGAVPPQSVRSSLVRDRGDGRRGSTTLPGVGKLAVTHVDVTERLPGYTLLSCRLETGRTHQIRIHLAELGHPVCGDPVYHTRRDGTVTPDESAAPRLALHAVELGFRHPATNVDLHWEMPLPDDLKDFVERLRRGHVNRD
jgi:23S rRNA pseudouridine1911/1915/1917 synthase